MDKTAFEALEKRVAAVEKPTTPGLTEARVTELMSTFLAGDEGKKLIGAEASRITMEASAATGTLPVKPAPAAAAPENSVKDLIAAGKFEEAFAASKDLQSEFLNAKSYAAYAKAEANGQTRVARN